MEDPAPAIPLEKLVAHREWVRRVARALVRDEALAEDLEQDVWLEALRRPPRSGRSFGGWLAAAMKHNLIDVRRSEGRRRAREEAASRPEAEKSAAEVVAEAELLRKVVAAVLDLKEPARGTLLLRYFEDLPLKEVARRQGIPLETVRTRVRTGLGLLRARFDAERGGDRKAWALALLPLVRGPEAAASGAGAGIAAGARGPPAGGGRRLGDKAGAPRPARARTGRGAVTTEIAPAPTFYFAEDDHQQYLAKNPYGYCGLKGTGVTCAIPAAAAV